MVRRQIRAIGQALGRRSRTSATAPVMRRWYTRTAASVPIASARNAGRSTILSRMLIASRVLASKGLVDGEPLLTALTSEARVVRDKPLGDQTVAQRGKQSSTEERR